MEKNRGAGGVKDPVREIQGEEVRRRGKEWACWEDQKENNFPRSKGRRLRKV